MQEYIIRRQFDNGTYRSTVFTQFGDYVRGAVDTELHYLVSGVDLSKINSIQKIDNFNLIIVAIV